MAKNKYQKYEFEGTYSCNHSGVLIQGGYTEDYARSVVDEKFSGLCDKCKRKRYEEESKVAAKEAEENGWATLEGSAKQIAWAESIRKEMVEVFPNVLKKIKPETLYLPHVYHIDLKRRELLTEEEHSKLTDLHSKHYDLDRSGKKEDEVGYKNFEKDMQELASHRLMNGFFYLLEKEVSASFFIENRYVMKEMLSNPSHWDTRQIFIKTIDLAFKSSEKSMEQRLKDEIFEEQFIISPESNGITVIVREYKTRSIKIYSEKNPILKSIVKNEGYIWGGGYWIREISEASGDRIDRIAEITHKLLKKGFNIQLDVNNYSKVKEMVKNNSYSQEKPGWIELVSKNTFSIGWKGYNDTIYNRGRSLRKAKYYSFSAPIIYVPIETFRELEEFAKLNNLAMTESAEKAFAILNKKASEMDGILDPREEEYVDGLKEILNSSAEVIEDLRDE